MKQVKIVLIAAILFLGANQVTNAQAKLAHIDVSELMTFLPEMKTAQAQIEKLSKTYDTEYRTMVDEYQNKLKKYEQEAPTVGDKINEERSKEVQTLGQNITQYRETAQKELQKKQEDIFKPILEKARLAIQKVAKAQGYQYVLDASSGGGVIFAEGPNLLNDVKKELSF